MSRRMSVSMTLEAVRNQTKTVTRRHVDTWKNLQPGDRLTLIEKGMGLPKGAKQVVVAEVEVVDVRVEPIGKVICEPDGVAREGFAEMDPAEFMWFWIESHYKSKQELLDHGIPPSGPPCRRIEWRYLECAAAGIPTASETKGTNA